MGRAELAVFRLAVLLLPLSLFPYQLALDHQRDESRDERQQADRRQPSIPAGMLPQACDEAPVKGWPANFWIRAQIEAKYLRSAKWPSA